RLREICTVTAARSEDWSSSRDCSRLESGLRLLVDNPHTQAWPPCPKIPMIDDDALALWRRHEAECGDAVIRWLGALADTCVCTWPSRPDSQHVRLGAYVAAPVSPECVGSSGVTVEHGSLDHGGTPP